MKLTAPAMRRLGLLALALGAIAHAEPLWQISVVGDLYPDGKALVRPTAEKPVFYMPIVKGYVELGAQLSSDVPPPARDVVHELAVALAGQGYLASRQIQIAAPAGTPRGANGQVPKTMPAFQPVPSMIMVFDWGSLRAIKVDINNADITTHQPPHVVNENQMLGLIAGKNLDALADFGMKETQIIEDVQNDHYFVMISAYDFASYMTNHKRVLLWVAKMSIVTGDSTLTQILPVLIKQGAPLFGRETVGPKQIEIPQVKEGHVEIGTATPVKD